MIRRRQTVAGHVNILAELKRILEEDESFETLILEIKEKRNCAADRLKDKITINFSYFSQ